MAVNLAIQSYSLVLTILLLLCSRLDSSRSSTAGRVMNALLWSNTALLTCYLAAALLEGRTFCLPLNLLFTCGKCGLAYLLAIFYTQYILLNIRAPGAGTRKLARALRAVCAAAMGLNVLSCFNGMYFTCRNGVYARGPLFLLNQALAEIVLLLDALLILTNARKLGRRTGMTLMSYAILPILAVLVQLPFPQIDTMGVAATLSLVLIYITVHVDRGRQLAEQKRRQLETDTAVMMSQLQPHFLFNALMAIQDLCHGRAPEAEAAVVEFAEFLRGNLDSLRHREPIPFERELQHTKNYLALENRRFSGRIRVEYELGPTGFLLPPLTLQPIVENAVRYGVTQRETGGVIRIATADLGEACALIVRDDGVGFDPAAPKHDGRAHVGLSAVRARVAEQCGGTLAVESAPGAGTTVTITIPKRSEAL